MMVVFALPVGPKKKVACVAGFSSEHWLGMLSRRETACRSLIDRGGMTGRLAEEEAITMAAWCADRQSRQVARALSRVAAAAGWRPRAIVLSGHGECLARRALARLGWNVDIVSLPESLGVDVSRAAPAHSLALIARGQLA